MATQQVKNLINILDGYVEKGGHHLNVNVFNKETLLDAQKNPEKHRDLIVRVWGWSGYFTELDKAFQDQIIAREAYGA